MKSLFLILFLTTYGFGAANFPEYAGKIHDCHIVLKNQDLTVEVKKAFDEVRQGSYSAANNLIKYGERVFPYLKPYLKDENEDVQRQLVKIVMETGGDQSLPLIAELFKNSIPQSRKNSIGSLYLYYSLALKQMPLGEFSKYKTFEPAKIAAQKEIGETLRSNIKEGNADFRGVFLLINFPGAETEDILKEAAQKSSTTEGEKKSLAAKIVLARLGNKEAETEVSKLAAGDNLQSLRFLLENIIEIDSKDILASLEETLDNKTVLTKGKADGTIHEKTADGLWIEYPVSRRLCDLAVNSFVEKFNLKVSFRLHSNTYTDKQISEVRLNLKKQSAETWFKP